MRLRVPRSIGLAVPVMFLSTASAAGAQCLNPNLPTSASTRALAMGDANTAGRDDDVIFYGPAQLAIARGTSIAASRYDTHVSSVTAASTARLATGGVGIGAQMTTARNGASCAAPENFARTNIAVGAAQTYKRFRVGATAKYVARQLGDDRASHLLADIGVARDVTVRDGVPLSIAFALQNIGASAADASRLQAPLRGALGFAAGAPVMAFDLAVAAQIAVEQNAGASIIRHGRGLGGGGVEVGYTWLDGYSFSLRAGVRTPPPFTDVRSFTAGAGLVLDRIAIDYAAEELVGSRFAHRLGVRLR